MEQTLGTRRLVEATYDITDMAAISMNGSENHIICYAPRMISTGGIWEGDKLLDFSLPLFITQMILIVVTTRFLVFVLRPLGQPKVVAEILGGVLLGPTGVGRHTKFANRMFPLRSVMLLETIANLGLLFFMFLVGVEMDLSMIKRTGREAIVLAMIGMVCPFIVGVITGYFFSSSVGIKEYSYLIFLGVAVSVTAFPVLARILADLKLLNTHLGRVSMSAAIVNDMSAWILLALAIAMAESDTSPLNAGYVVLAATAFIFFCVTVLRPAVEWIVKQTPEGEQFSDFYICILFTGVMLCGFITDIIGTHSVFGAFVFGLIIPNGPLGTILIEKLEDFVSTLMLPLFFAISGLRTDLRTIENIDACLGLLAIVILSGIAKVTSTLFVALHYQMPFREGLTLGMLMNTKGLIEIIVLNVGRDQKVIDEQSFAIMILSAVVMTGITVPIIRAIIKPSRSSRRNYRATIQSSKKDAELKFLVCVYTSRNVPTIINLVETSHPTRKSPICIYTLHLMELTGRASAMLIVHNSHKSGRPANRSQAQSDHIVNAFDNYAQQTDYVTVQPLTVISPYSTMHEDICNLAEDKRVSFIILPFHKQQTIDGGMEVTNVAFRNVNQNVLANAPCSVGILIDRGFGGSNRVSPGDIAHHIMLLFFGGPDDREALSYAWRMAEHPGIKLTVVRFLPEDAVEAVVSMQDQERITVHTDTGRENQLDNKIICDFKLKNTGKETIVYKERIVNNGEETVTAIRTLNDAHDLYIVGRGQGAISPLTAGLTDWSECPELGAIGDVLASSDFSVTVSVLVVQQYIGEAMHGEFAQESVSDRSNRHAN